MAWKKRLWNFFFPSPQISLFLGPFLVKKNKLCFVALLSAIFPTFSEEISASVTPLTCPFLWKKKVSIVLSPANIQKMSLSTEKCLSWPRNHVNSRTYLEMANSCLEFSSNTSSANSQSQKFPANSPLLIINSSNKLTPLSPLLKFLIKSGVCKKMWPKQLTVHFHLKSIISST